MNRCVETYLRCFTADKPSHWSNWLPWAEYNYSTSFHTATGTTPFKLVYGRKPPPVIHFEWGSTANQEMASLLLQRDAILEEPKPNLHPAQQKMKAHVDSKRKDVQWKVGEFVCLKLHPYRQATLARRVNEKLAPRFYGPFRILEQIGPVAYKLELPYTTHIHLVFHVSLLRKAMGSQLVSSTIPSSITMDLEQLVQLAAVLVVHPSTVSGQESPEVLIH